MTKTLLHACCGVCALEPVRIFKEEGRDFALAFINPNIHPAQEYRARLDTLERYVAKPNKIKVLVPVYNTNYWESCCSQFTHEKKKRCKMCYQLRFQELAKLAKQKGFDTICTTLSISPYQYHELIFAELQNAAKKYGLSADCTDFKKYYKEATRLSRLNGMYRQKYCGCRFSKIEAQEEQNKEEKRRSRAKEIKSTALIMSAAEGCVNQVSKL